MAVGFGPPPAKPRAPVLASVFGDPSGTVDLAQALVHRRGDELKTGMITGLGRVSLLSGWIRRYRVRLA
jgi:hypothetical protein